MRTVRSSAGYIDEEFTREIGMTKLLLAGAGGFIGSALRYLLAAAIDNWYGRGDFPFGTLAVNVMGCLIIGLLTFLAEARGFFSAELRVFLVIGILGGFTTFSSF